MFLHFGLAILHCSATVKGNRCTTRTQQVLRIARIGSYWTAIFDRLRCEPQRSGISLAQPKLPRSQAGCTTSENIRTPIRPILEGVCTENLIRVDDVMESPKLAE